MQIGNFLDWKGLPNVHILFCLPKTSTKIVIFSRGKVRKAPTFLFGGDEICVCDDYVYLGTTFNYNNSLKKAINKQVSQARRALYSMKSKILPLLLPIDVKLELFEHLVIAHLAIRQ